MDRALDNEDMVTASASTPDMKVSGNPGAWVLVCKASSQSQGWMKSTKAMDVPHGVLVQVTTEHRHNGIAVACAEALSYLPGISVADLVSSPI